MHQQPFTNRVDTGHNLWDELGDYHHDDTGQQTSLQKQGLNRVVKMTRYLRGPNLDSLWHREEEAAWVPAVDGCQLGSEEDEADNEDLAAHQELLYVVTFRGKKSQPEGRR